MYKNILEQLEAADSEEEREWLLLQMVLHSQPVPIQTAIWAAAIPHWFDLPFLIALLDETEREMFFKTGDFETITRLSFVEQFAGKGYNVHERSRALFLNRLWQEERERYLKLSRRAAIYCANQDQTETHWQVETVYHQLLSDDATSLDAFIALGIEWQNDNRAEALIRPILSAAAAGRLSGEVVAWTFHILQNNLLIIYSHHKEVQTNLELALAHHTKYPSVRANGYKILGDIHLKLGEVSFPLERYRIAKESYQIALNLYKEMGDKVGEANCVRAIGDTLLQEYDYEKAQKQYENALVLYRHIGDKVEEAACIKAIGDTLFKLSSLAQAQMQYELALSLYQDLGYRRGEAHGLSSLGDILAQKKAYKQARTYYDQALNVFREIGEKLGEANILKSLGDVTAGLDNLVEAHSYYSQALSIYQNVGDGIGEAKCLLALYDIASGLDYIEEDIVIEWYQKALNIMERIRL